jgi:hypothetical protein
MAFLRGGGECNFKIWVLQLLVTEVVLFSLISDFYKETHTDVELLTSMINGCSLLNLNLPVCSRLCQVSPPGRQPNDSAPSDARLRDMKARLDQKGREFQAAVGKLNGDAEWRAEESDLLPVLTLSGDARVAVRY